MLQEDFSDKIHVERREDAGRSIKDLSETFLTTIKKTNFKLGYPHAEDKDTPEWYWRSTADDIEGRVRKRANLNLKISR